jgi:glycosyltransferase involved in cell wall biosynthesis
MNSRTPLVSIVTPVYNGAAHIRQCMESVLSQSYEHWDYTIVNNRSEDQTLEIAQEFARKDPRIRVRDNDEFLPLIANHNEALRQISADSIYCKVLAADDRLHPDYLRETVRVAASDSRIAIVGTYASDGERVRYRGVPEELEVMPGRDVCRRNLLGGPYVFGPPTTVLYRSDIVRTRASFYDEFNVHSDTEVCFEFLADRKFGFVHRVLAYVAVREESMTTLAQRIDSYRTGWLRVLLHHGHHYLEPDELERLIERDLRRYRRFLGDQLFKLRGDEFWSFHREQLADLGYPIRRLDMAREGARFLWDRIFRHPLRTLENIGNRLRG